MHAAVTAAFDSIAGMTHSRKVEIDIHPALTGLMVSANADRLRQVLINVLSNAVKYNTSAKPRIEVRTVTDSKEVWVDVVDNGGGVTRADAATIFEKFARGNRPSTDQGAGLGLPISRAFMNAMNGDLTVEFVSESVSFFRLSLARAEANPAAAQ
jgi:K+-sensing histidine kinase KdpD